MGYADGSFPPNVHMPDVGGYKASHNIIRAHARAYHIYQDEFRFHKGRWNYAFIMAVQDHLFYWVVYLSSLVNNYNSLFEWSSFEQHDCLFYLLFTAISVFSESLDPTIACYHCVRRLCVILNEVLWLLSLFTIDFRRFFAWETRMSRGCLHLTISWNL